VEKHAGCSIRHKVKGGCHTSTTNAVMVATIKEAGRSSHNLLSRARRYSASALCTRTLFLALFAKSREAIGITIEQVIFTNTSAACIQNNAWGV